ncbi:CHASE2 domain-containing protein [Deinococcus altitudinis]|uniref:CHASE2 domain-containing protein n=1 Tax=Deinococcus altitudinis TaxID=468914 RepID=UPI00389224E3
MRFSPDATGSLASRWGRATSAPRLLPTLTGWLLAAAVLLALLFSLLTPLNQALWDALNRALPAPPDPRVVVVGIDDATIRDYGRLDTWDRSLYARALKTLDDAGVRAVGLDILFQGSANGDEVLAPLLARPNVILATTPDDPLGQDLGPRVDSRATTGLSILNISPDGVVRNYQHAYRLQDGSLAPSMAEQLARAAGMSAQTSTLPQTLRYLANDRSSLPVLPFRDLVNGNVRYSSLQDKLVIVGLTATGSQGSSYLDVARLPVPGVILQARAVSSMLSAPFRTLSPWIGVFLGVVAAVCAVLLRGMWGFVIALVAVGLSLPLWLADVQFPGATVSLCAVIGLLLVAGERWWQLRHLGTVDPLTGLGNRLAFTRAVEHRWASRVDRPIGLLLVDLTGFRSAGDRLGIQAGDALLQHLAGTLRGNKRRADVVFRWGSDEFVLLVDGSDPQELSLFANRLQQALAEVEGKVKASIGHAMTGPDIHTPTELIERASRMRYRNKYRDE